MATFPGLFLIIKDKISCMGRFIVREGEYRLSKVK
jgi:hypothetical protein